MNPAKRHHPDPTAAAAMAAMHEHQMAAIFAANAAGGMAAMHTVPGLAQELSGPGPHLEDEEKEVRGVVTESMREVVDASRVRGYRCFFIDALCTGNRGDVLRAYACVDICVF